MLSPLRKKVPWSKVVAGRPGAIGPGNFPQTPFKWTFHRGGRYGDPNRLATSIKWVTFGAEFGAKVGNWCGVALRNPSKLLARPAGLEPATSGLETHCSIQLSYGRKRLEKPPKVATVWAICQGGQQDH